MKILLFNFICFFLVIVLWCAVFFLSFSKEGSFASKGSSFECGFQPFSGSSVSFSMPFFTISLMFLLFDVEILLVCFYPLVNSFSFYSLFFMSFIILFILVATLYEWLKGVLIWL